VVQRRRPARDHLGRGGVDVLGLLQRGLEHPEDREEHHDREDREQDDLDAVAELALAADGRRRRGLAGDPGVGDAGRLDVRGHL
jgi:hypothetical protein